MDWLDVVRRPRATGVVVILSLLLALCDLQMSVKYVLQIGAGITFFHATSDVPITLLVKLKPV